MYTEDKDEDYIFDELR